MIPNIMSLKSIGLLAFAKLMVKSHLNNYAQHPLNELAKQFLKDTSHIDIDNLRKLHVSSLKAYQVVAKSYVAEISRYKDEDEYSPLILAFDLMDEWFNSGHPLIVLPSYLEGYEFTAILDLAVEHHGGWEGYIKTSRVLSKALCKKLLKASCV